MDIPDFSELCSNFPIYKPWQKGTKPPKYLYLMEYYSKFHEWNYDSGLGYESHTNWRVLTDQKQFITKLYQFIIGKGLKWSSYYIWWFTNHIRLTLIPINEQLKRTLTTKIKKQIKPYHLHKKNYPYINGICFEFPLNFSDGILCDNSVFNLEELTADQRGMYLEDKLLNQTINVIPTEFIEEFRKIFFYNNLENLPERLENLRPISDFFSQSTMSVESRSSWVNNISKPKYVQLDLSKLTPINVIYHPDVRNYNSDFFVSMDTQSQAERQETYTQPSYEERLYYYDLIKRINKMKCSKTIMTADKKNYRWCCLDNFDNFDQTTIWDNQAHIENAIKLSRHIQNYHTTD